SHQPAPPSVIEQANLNINLNCSDTTTIYVGVWPLVSVAGHQYVENKIIERNHIMAEQTNVRFINQAALGYSHIVEVRGGRTLYIAGQLALDKDGNLVGRDD